MLPSVQKTVYTSDKTIPRRSWVNLNVFSIANMKNTSKAVKSSRTNLNIYVHTRNHNFMFGRKKKYYTVCEANDWMNSMQDETNTKMKELFTLNVQCTHSKFFSQHQYCPDIKGRVKKMKVWTFTNPLLTLHPPRKYGLNLWCFFMLL